jgi:hypothetical protein
LSQNNLTGTIPTSLSSIPSLISLYVIYCMMQRSYNKFKLLICFVFFFVFGLLKKFEFSLKLFQYLMACLKLFCSTLSSNDLSGQVPEHLFQVSKYKYEEHQSL